MFRWLAALIIIVPAAELWGIIQMGRWIGGWQTFALILLSGFAGAWLAREEGRKVWIDAQRRLQTGEMPGRALLDGLCVIAGGLMLMLPGFFSDIVGVTLLLPFTRPIYRVLLYKWLERKFRSGAFRFGGGPFRS